MKRAAFLAIATALLLTLVLPGSLPAQASTVPTWTSIIAYFNPNPGGVNPVEELGLIVYDDQGKLAISLPQDINMQPYQSGTLLIGKITGMQGFKGSAVMSSSVPVVAVYKQAPNDSTPYSPILYTSFDVSQAGLGKIYIPSIQRTLAYDSEVGVQNIETAAALMTLHFYNEDGTELSAGPFTVPANRSFVFRASDYLIEEFHGSMMIESLLANTTELNARMVAAVQEVQIGGRRAYAFEGVSGGSPELFMPSAACAAGQSKQTTSFAVQNVGAGDSDVSVEYSYYDENQNLQTLTSSSKTLAPGFSARFSPCDADVAAQLSGVERMTAVIRSTAENIAAVCRLDADDGLMTAYLGQPAPTSPGRYYLLLPYVEWSAQAGGIHTEIVVMNTTGEAASDVDVIYYHRNGKVAAEHKIGSTGSDGPLPAYAARSSSPSSVRIIGARGFNGAVIIESSVPVVALARVTRDVDVDGYTVLGDDYSGIPYNNP